MTPKLPVYDWTAKDRAPVFAWIIRTAENCRIQRLHGLAIDNQTRRVIERLRCVPLRECTSASPSRS